MTVETPIPTIVIDDTAIKRRGVCEFVEETSLLRLYAQAGDASETLQLVEKISEQHPHNKDLAAWLVLSDLRLGNDNGVDLGRALLEIAPGLLSSSTRKNPAGPLLLKSSAVNTPGVASLAAAVSARENSRGCTAMPSSTTLN